MNMNCRVVRKQMIFYTEGKIEGRENEQIRLHIADCKDCSHLYEELASTLEITEKRKPLEANPYLYIRIKDKLEVLEQSGGITAIPVYQRVLQPVVLTMVLLLGLYGGNRLGNFYDLNRQQVSSTPTTEYYLNDIQQERLEVLLLNE